MSTVVPACKALEIAKYELYRKHAKTEDEDERAGVPALKRVLKKILWDAEKCDGQKQKYSEFTEPIDDWIVHKLESWHFLVVCNSAHYRAKTWTVSWHFDSDYESPDYESPEDSFSLFGSSPPTGLFLPAAAQKHVRSLIPT